MSILTELILEGRIYSSLSVIVGNTMGGNKSFFSLLGLWETLGGLGSFWSIQINLGRLWEPLGDSGGAFGEALGGLGELWEALGMLWNDLGRRWEALGMPATRRRTKLYTKMLGVRKLPINQLCWPMLVVLVSSSSVSYTHLTLPTICSV